MFDFTKIKFHYPTKVKSHKAFALLYTALISSLLLSLAMSISVIVMKDIRLSSISRESQKAFYAADSAAECALYWSFRKDKFATSTAVTSGVICDDQDIAGPTHELPGLDSDGVQGVGGTNLTKYRYEIDGKYCAVVFVYKNNTAPKTVIEARGYNTRCDSQSRIKLERAVRLQY